MTEIGYKTAKHRLLFLPGASGDANFWKPVGARLPDSWEKHYLNWPGLGNQPDDPAIRSMQDMYAHAAKSLESPSVVVAQSMGGIVALMLALRHPERVTNLILTATSGGLNVADFGAEDWRPAFLAAFPNTARWILDEQPDLTPHLASLRIPALLIWGDEDEISPVGVGRFLNCSLPSSTLHLISGGSHSLAHEMPEAVAPLICRHLKTG